MEHKPTLFEHMADSLSAMAPYLTGFLIVLAIIGLYFQSRRKDADTVQVVAYSVSTMTMIGIVHYAISEQNIAAAFVGLAFSSIALMSLTSRA